MTRCFICLIAVGIVATGIPFAASASPPVKARATGQVKLAANSMSQDAQRWSELPVWNDGLCEMSYYRATDQIYGRLREYTRVHLVNRQWMDESTGVKTKRAEDGAAPVFKFNIAEEIPTENYNYRYLTTLFLRRPDLTPLKMVTSSQEWCGSTFKHLRWFSDELVVRSFSYFGGEGDSTWTISADAIPYEALLLIARQVASTGESVTVNVLAPMRSNHQVQPNTMRAKIVAGPMMDVRVPAGKYTARRIEVVWEGRPTGFMVEATPPYLLLRFRTGPIRGELQHVERRAYWDTQSPSTFYKPRDAP